MTRGRLLALAVVGAAALAGCGGGSSGGDVATVTQPTSPPPSSSTTGCSAPGTGKPSNQQFGQEPKLTIAKTTYTATITTNCGVIKVALDGKHAPRTVNSFNFLAAHHFFDNTLCHRLTTSGIFVLQCGDPTATGSGGPGYEIPDENLEGAAYPAGTVAMANAGANTGGSQFFFVYADTQLPPSYTPFGRVTAGLDILQRIAEQGSTPPDDGAPNQPVFIQSFTVAKGKS